MLLRGYSQDKNICCQIQLSNICKLNSVYLGPESPALQADSLPSEPLGKAQNRAKFPVYHHIQEKKKSKYLFNTHLRTKKINFPAVSEMNKNIFYKDD